MGFLDLTKFDLALFILDTYVESLILISVLNFQIEPMTVVLVCIDDVMYVCNYDNLLIVCINFDHSGLHAELRLLTSCKCHLRISVFPARIPDTGSFRQTSTNFLHSFAVYHFFLFRGGICHDALPKQGVGMTPQHWKR